MSVTIISHSGRLSYKWLRLPVIQIPEFDEQHQQLLESMNALKESQLDTVVEDFQHRLTALHVLYSLHFQTEEQRMLMRGYGGFSAHADAHQKFLDGPLLTIVQDPGGQNSFNLDALILWEANHILILLRNTIHVTFDREVVEIHERSYIAPKKVPSHTCISFIYVVQRDAQLTVTVARAIATAIQLTFGISQ